jgi:hypothetical protein
MTERSVDFGADLERLHAQAAASVAGLGRIQSAVEYELDNAERY